MSTLQERLDRIREGFEKQAPPEVLTVMHHATDDLRASRQCRLAAEWWPETAYDPALPASFGRRRTAD